MNYEDLETKRSDIPFNPIEMAKSQIKNVLIMV